MARPRPRPPGNRPRPTSPRPRPSAPATTLARPTPATLVDWRSDREVARATTAILALHTTGETNAADTIVAIGTHLATIQARLPFGQWREWIHHELPMHPRTAQRWIAIAVFAQRDPDDYRRLRHLGYTKLRIILPLPPSRRRALRPGAPVVVRGLTKTLESMTTDDLLDHLGLAALQPDAAEPLAELVKSVRFRIAGLGALADELIARKSEVGKPTALAIKNEIEDVMGKLELAFAL